MLDSESRSGALFHRARGIRIHSEDRVGAVLRGRWNPRAVGLAFDALVGAVDVTVGMMVLFAPRRFALGYMGGWALWTALLRPLSGEPFFETLERAGNYGVPLALLLMSGWPRDVRS